MRPKGDRRITPSPSSVRVATFLRGKAVLAPRVPLVCADREVVGPEPSDRVRHAPHECYWEEESQGCQGSGKKRFGEVFLLSSSGDATSVRRGWETIRVATGFQPLPPSSTASSKPLSAPGKR